MHFKLRYAFKIYIEAFKTIIEVVRTNNKLEEYMPSICAKMFAFLVKFNRKQEVKRICADFLSYVQKIINIHQMSHSKTLYTIDISLKDTNSRYFNLFLDLYQACEKLGLYQDGLKVIEMLNEILKSRKTASRPKMLSDYYESLAQLCWQGKYYLYHAHAFIQHYLIYKKHSEASLEEMQHKTNYLIMALISIPQNPQVIV